MSINNDEKQHFKRDNTTTISINLNLNELCFLSGLFSDDQIPTSQIKSVIKLLWVIYLFTS